MKRARKAETPKGLEVQNFGERFLAWWHSLQPTWRVSTHLAAPGTYKRGESAEGSLECLNKGGSNGIFLVIVSIGWLIAAHGEKPINPAVQEVIEDVSWVLEVLSRGSGTGEGVSPPKREKRKGDSISTPAKR
jgi:hypothetical protein